MLRDEPIPENLFGEVIIAQNVNSSVQSLSETAVEKENFTDGVYRHRFFDGTIYEGSWKNGAIEGYGEVTWYDGNVYKGMWKNNFLDGHGEYTYSNG